jgi:hypothetical protein
VRLKRYQGILVDESARVLLRWRSDGFLCERRESLLSLISFSRSEEKLSAKVLVLSAK